MSEYRNYWTAENVTLLRSWYLDQQLTPAAIAKRLQIKVTRVRRKITTLGLPPLRDEALLQSRRRELSDAAYAGRLRAKAARGEFVWTDAYVAELTRLYLDEDMPSAEIAARFGIKATGVRRKVVLLGLTKLRKAKGVKRRRVRRLGATTNVVRLPTGYAAGISNWEAALKSAPPPVPVDPAAHARRQRAGRKTAFYYAARRQGDY